MPKSPALWEPYCHRADAEFHLSKFAGRVLGPKAGVIFFDGQAAARLKPAVPDADGHALDLVVSTTRLPVAMPDPLSDAGPQTIQQLAQAWSHRVAAASGPTALDRGIATARNFIDGHKTGFDTAAVVGDTFGILAGIISMAVMFGGGIALVPALGILAGVASTMLLYEDGSMLWYDITGDEAGRKRRENTWHYKLVETVGPILVLPDLAASGARTLTSLPKLSREVGEATEEAAQAVKRLADQRKAIDSLTRTKLDNPDQALMRQQANQMREQAGNLADRVGEAQKKLAAASRELMLVRTIEAPAYMATIYSTGVYGINPPDTWPTAFSWIKDHAQKITDHAANLLVPHSLGSSGQAGDPTTALQFQVSVSHHPGHAR
jgi:hypothetical protein